MQANVGYGRTFILGGSGHLRPSRRQILTAAILIAASAGPSRARSKGEETAREALPFVEAVRPWTVLPPTPDLPPASESRTISVSGVPIFYARFGQGPVVLLLHGGMANSNYWGHQIRHLSERFSVIAMDTRGHGRSPLATPALSYPLFAQDAVGLLDALGVRKAAVVGWSDGAITGLELAMSYPDRIERLFAFAGNVSRSAMKRCAGDCPTFVAYAKRCKAEYAAMSPNPEAWPEFVKALRAMWRAQQAFEKPALARIEAPTVIADGQYDEIIKPNHVTEMAGMIHGARAVSLPRTSHFAMLQDPEAFNVALDRFIVMAPERVPAARTTGR